MIEITDKIRIPSHEVEFSFVRASGPGGQNVNKVATAVQLRFNARSSPSLPAAVKDRLLRLAGTRATRAGVIVLNADRFRSQSANRKDAVARLVRLIRDSLYEPKSRIPTRPSLAAKRKRLDSKKKRSRTKVLRSSRIGAED